MAVAVFLFAFTSIVSNYYYGETNLQFICKRRWPVAAYRLAVGAMVMVGSVTSLELAWSLADVFMGLMTLMQPRGHNCAWSFCRKAPQRLHRPAPTRTKPAVPPLHDPRTRRQNRLLYSGSHLKSYLFCHIQPCG